MKKLVYLGIAACIALLFILPYGINYVLNCIDPTISATVRYRIDVEGWHNAIAIIIPTVLSYFVYKQSEIQQAANESTQKRLERMNRRLLDNELKAHRGYFIPETYAFLGEGKNRIEYPHQLDKYISLANEGNDLVFVSHVDVVANSIPTFSGDMKPVCFWADSPHKVFSLEPHLTEELLKASQIDFVITLHLKNSRGFSYIEVLEAGFSWDGKSGRVNALNMEFQEDPNYAD